MEFETVIGLEVHCQLATQSKIFCSAPAEFGAEPNSHVDPLTLGLPGALPVLNRAVVEYAVMLGLALNCEIRRFSRFARKHYFYPDLPKGYQISQFEEPICERGTLKIRLGESVRTIGITRVHMEEDAGKNIHSDQLNASLIDLNRAGVPLLEIVSEPDLRSPAEAAAYLRALRQTVRFLGVSDGNMEQGSLRCDANISLRPRGSLKFGTRTEIKNLNSFRFVEKALEYEVARQLKIVRSGGSVVQETLLYDSDAEVTRPMRGKEESADYRYFPDPDLPPVVVADAWIKSTLDRMPRLPEACFRNLTEKYQLNSYDAGALTAEISFVEFFEETCAACRNPKASANWILTELFGRLNRDSLELAQSPVNAQGLGELIGLIDSGTLSGKMAKAVFEEMFRSGRSAAAIVAEQGLEQIIDPEEIRRFVSKVLEQNPEQTAKYLAGSEKLLGFFIGQIMKLTKGSASPQVANSVLLEELANLKAAKDD